MPDRHEHDTVATVGDENKQEVGRIVGQDEGYAGPTGAEARAETEPSEE